MIRTPVVIGGLVAGIWLLGCKSGRAADRGVPDSTFVATLGDLRRVESDTSLDPTMRDSTRRLILRRHRVTSAQLERAARALAQSPARASEMWRQIESPPRVLPPPRTPATPPRKNPPAPRS